MKPCPLAHGTWEPVPEFSDEFLGTQLDPAKWHPNNPGWKGRQPAFFAKHNVAVRDGMLHLTMRKEDLDGLPKGYHTFTSAAVQSKAKVRYGYFEIRCRPMDSNGSSAFWFYDGTPEIWTEIDVLEMGAGNPKHQHTVHMNTHVFHTLVNPDRHWSRGGKWQAPWRLADAFHLYALEWDPVELKYYVDGKVVLTLKNTHCHQPLTLNFDSETMPQWFGLPEPDTLPSTFSIDYVRAWRRVDLPGTPPASACTFAFPNAQAAAGKQANWTIHAADGETLAVAARLGPDGKPSLVHLVYANPAFFQAQTGPRASRRVGVTDRHGRQVSFAITWEKVKGHEPNAGYRADTVAVEPAEPLPAGSERVYEFAAQGGQTVRMTLRR